MSSRSGGQMGVVMATHIASIMATITMANTMETSSWTATGCPSACTCSPNWTTVDCEVQSDRWADLAPLGRSIHKYDVAELTVRCCKTSFPPYNLHEGTAVFTEPVRTQQFATLKSLSVSNLVIPNLFDGLFMNFPQLQNLNLEQNSIKRVYANTFQGLTNLRHLDISSNRLERLCPFVFRHLPRLEYLSLQRNALHHLPHRVFANLLRLRVLLLQGNRLPLDLAADLQAHLASLPSISIVRLNLPMPPVQGDRVTYIQTFGRISPNWVTFGSSVNTTEDIEKKHLRTIRNDIAGVALHYGSTPSSEQVIITMVKRDKLLFGKLMEDLSLSGIALPCKLSELFPKPPEYLELCTSLLSNLTKSPSYSKTKTGKTTRVEHAHQSLSDRIYTGADSGLPESGKVPMDVNPSRVFFARKLMSVGASDRHYSELEVDAGDPKDEANDISMIYSLMFSVVVLATLPPLALVCMRCKHCLGKHRQDKYAINENGVPAVQVIYNPASGAVVLPFECHDNPGLDVSTASGTVLFQNAAAIASTEVNRSPAYVHDAMHKNGKASKIDNENCTTFKNLNFDEHHCM